MDNQLPDDGLKWFGQGFDGFPKRLPDDCVEYIIYVINEKLDSASAIRSRLNEIVRAAKILKESLLKEHIWQRDDFELSVHPKLENAKSSASAPTHLRGRTNFGDSVADEWVIVYLLSELSKRFPDAWFRVFDTDGEFLLIEAANALPKWLNPEIAENRIWLNEGRIKIIALDEGGGARNMSLQDALSLIGKDPLGLLVDPAIEKEAFYRLREYPSAISSSLHNSLITIPRRLAYILHRKPAYISPAVESFYLRDAVSLKPLATKDLSTLNFPPEDFVTVSIKFTKVGFAQLRSQIFDAPPGWTAVIPRMSDDKVTTGMKLACGFEMLVSDPQNQDKRAVQEIKLLLDDVESGEEALPSNDEILSWPKTHDDEKWLDIDYNDFEKELSGEVQSKNRGKGDGFGDQSAQENLRKMVSRFKDFLNDEDVGAAGVDDMDNDNDNDDDNSSMGESAHVEQTDTPATDDANFDRSMKETRSMNATQIEESGLLDEARKLALQDDEGASDIDEDEEMRKVMELMEKELKGHGALNLNSKDHSKSKGKAPVANISTKSGNGDKVFFGPARPPDMQNAMTQKSVHLDDDDEDVGPGDLELSSDDEEFNDIDLGLAKNMLESFKGQAGMAGPAGNMMKALGIGLPRDEDSD